MKKIFSFIFYFAFLLMLFDINVSASKEDEDVNYYLGEYKGTKLLYDGNRIMLNLNNINIYKVTNYSEDFYMVNVMDLPENEEIYVCEVKILPNSMKYRTKGNINLSDSLDTIL